MRRGLMMGLGCLGLLVLVALLLFAVGTGQYNRLVQLQEEVAAQWANVESAYQRRADLIPNLVATVRGSAQFEQETLRQVVEARSRVGQVSAEAGAEIVNDPQRFRQLEREAKLLAQLNHRHVVTIYDVLDDNGECWLVM